MLYPITAGTKVPHYKNTLRFELHFRLCFGKVDGAEKLRLEQQGGFGRNVRIAFFRTFFSKKKVHKDKGTAFAENSRLDDFCTSRLANSFRHFLSKMPPTLFSAKAAMVLCTLAYLPLKTKTEMIFHLCFLFSYSTDRSLPLIFLREEG